MLNTCQLFSIISSYSRNIEPLRCDAETEKLIRKLFEITDQIKPVGDDDEKTFWFSVKRCSFEEYKEWYYEDDDAYSEDELKRYYLDDYPDEIIWFKFTSIQHNFRGEEFKGVFINNKYVLNIGDINARGVETDLTELAQFLIDEAQKVVDELKANTYNEKIRNELPAKYKFGYISRRDYYDIYPGIRNEYRKLFSEKEIEKFVKLSESPYIPDETNSYSSMTARMYFEACATGYEALNLPEKEGKSYKIKDVETEEEHARYKGLTPREMYCMYADGRDNGLTKLPLDDPEAFEKWLNKDSAYYEFNGSHPWEVIPSFSTSFSLHFMVSSPYRIIDKRIEKLKGFYFSLSGETYMRSADTIKFYLALIDAGYKVELFKHREMAERFLETDRLQIVPCYCMSGFDTDDTISLNDKEYPEKIEALALWEEEKVLQLKN